MQKIIIILLILSQSKNTNTSQQNTSIPTLKDCNYAIQKGNDFYETYPIDICYNIGANSLKYHCNPTLYEFIYRDTTCNDTISQNPSDMMSYCNNTNDKCGTPVMVNKYYRNQSDPCSKPLTEPISSIPFITGFCIQTPDGDPNASAIYNQYNAQQAAITQYGYGTLPQCINQNTPNYAFSIPPTANNANCSYSSPFYYDIQIPATTTAPSMEPTLEPTANSQTIANRNKIPCNYAVKNVTGFYITYPINTCYVIPYPAHSLSQKYVCKNGSVQELDWYGDTCAMARPPDVLFPPSQLSGITAQCEVDKSNTNTCEFKLLLQYDRNMDHSCSKMGENYLHLSLPWILNYCIPIDGNITIYNEYNASKPSLIQYRYETMDNCLHGNAEFTESVTIAPNYCAAADEFYYYEIAKDATTSPTTEPTMEPTLLPTSEPTTEPTTEPTMLSPGSRQEIPCNYGVADEGLFFETFPMNECYVIPHIDSSIYRQYQCDDTAINELSWVDNDCNASISAPDDVRESNITARCDVDMTHTIHCEYEVIQRYHRSISTVIGCGMDGAASFDKAIPMIINYCIATLNGRVVYNEYNVDNITQYIYTTMQDCKDHNSYTEIVVDPYKCERGWYYQLAAAVVSTAGPIVETTKQPSNEPTNEPTKQPTDEPTLEPTTETIMQLDCKYGLRILNEFLFYETVLVNECYDDASMYGTSMQHVCINDTIMDRYYTDMSCAGDLTQTVSAGNINAYCNALASDTTQCNNSILIRQYESNGTCAVSQVFKTYGFIINECIFFEANTFIKNAFDSSVLIQFSYGTYEECTNDINSSIVWMLPGEECKQGYLYEIVSPTTWEPTTSPTTTSPFPSELDCNYGLWEGPDFLETFVTNECYAGYDPYDIMNIESVKYECIDGIMYKQVYLSENCHSIPDTQESVEAAYFPPVQEHCNYNNIEETACDFVWIHQYYSRADRCGPEGLVRTMAFVIDKCLFHKQTNITIRNYFDGYKWSLTQFQYGSIEVCMEDLNGSAAFRFSKIVDSTCPLNKPYFYEIEVPTTAQPTFVPTMPTDAPTHSPNPSNTELQCNYGVNYGEFYETYVLDACYDLNPVKTAIPIPISLRYECDFITGNINENVWENEICSANKNHTNAVAMLSRQCDVSKSGVRCQFVWLNQFRKHSAFCGPHEHDIIKYGMIVDECIWFDVDNTAFRNKYTMNEDLHRQIMQFQYDNIDDCFLDEVYVNEGDVTNSRARNILYFTDNDCSEDKYYSIQPVTGSQTPTSAPTATAQTTTTMSPETTTAVTVPQINATVTSVPHINTTITPEIDTTHSVEETTSQTYIIEDIIEETTLAPTNGSESIDEGTTAAPTSDICNYMLRQDTLMDVYSTILENKCYSHNTGSKKYQCKNGKFMQTEWYTDELCDGSDYKAKPAEGETHCFEDNNQVCDIIAVLQYNGDEHGDNCTKQGFVAEYTFIINICLQYTGGNNKRWGDMVYVYNEYDPRIPDEITQFHFDSYDECINAEFGMEAGAEHSDSVQIIDGECTDDFYYELLLAKEPTPPPTINIIFTTGPGAESEVEPYYKRIYQSIFGPEGPTSIEVDILMLAVIVIFGCLCCGILCWCGWLKGITDVCWNVACCGRYSRLSDAPHKGMADEDSGDDSVEMGIAHVLVPGDNMELAALSEHQDNDDVDDKKYKRWGNRKPKKPNKRDRL